MKKETSRRYLLPLSLVYLTVMVSSTSLAYKPVKILFFTATSSSLLYSLTFSIVSIIAEIYGKNEAKKIVNSVIACGLLFSLLVTLVPLLPSPSDFHHQDAYSYVFGFSLRFALIGTVASYISYKVNIYFITKWQTLTNRKYFIFRVIGANTIGEFFLVLITTFGAFYNVFPLKEVINMFFFAYFSKIIFAVLLSWPSSIIAKIIEKKESNVHATTT